ncbi:MAG: RagB/SusD family nutrient uptake outer membrane protein [Balneolales bacterium]
MKRIIKFPLILFTVLLCMTSCSENFLQPEPKSFFAPENVYVDRAGFEALLVTLRRHLAHGEFTGGRGSALILGQWGETPAAINRYMPDRRNLNPSGAGRVGYYGHTDTAEDGYVFIKDANVIISRIDNVEWQSEQDRNEVLAEALWHRSYWYNRLVHTYGDVPFIGEEVTGARIDYQTHTREAVLDKIQEDMEFAVEHLPTSAPPGAVTRGAGNHLLAKIYLANMEYTNAVEAATDVINGPYALMTGRFGVDAGDPEKNVNWDLHRPENKNDLSNTETILAIVDRYEAPSNARSSGLLTMRTYHCDFWNTHNSDSEGNRGMIDAGAMYDTLGRGNPDTPVTEFYTYNVWNQHGDTWDNTPDERRADINWYDIDEMRYNNPESVNYGEKWRFEWVNSDPGRLMTGMCAAPIYKTYVPEGNPEARPSGGNGDWYLFRLAETYLIRAEAHYWLDNMPDAAEDINVVRRRSNATEVSPGEVTLDYIMDERVRELFAEGMQHNELVRVSFTMAKEGGYGYDMETLHENNWWYDRMIEKSHWYEGHPETGLTIGVGIPYPVTDAVEEAIELRPYVDPFNFLWPMPDAAIEANVLGTVNQNIGYPGAQNNEPPLETIE